MIEEPTCLILGAGASAPYGLPTAFELRDLILVSRSPGGPSAAEKFPRPPSPSGPSGVIAGELNNVRRWHSYLERMASEAGFADVLGDFWNKFFRSDRSIDWFLRHNEEAFGAVARFQIAAVLLNCERDEKLSGDWYRELSHHLFQADLNQLKSGKLSVITFNYDRSFEAYFLRVLESQYGLSFVDAQAVFNRIELHHVYGHLGAVNEIPYGDKTRIATSAQRIRVIRPDAENPIREQARNAIRQSTYINFIGFGFDEDNVALLGPENFKGKRVYSTSRGLGVRVKQFASRTLGVRFEKNAPDLDASQLFHTKDLFGPKVTPPTKRQTPVRRRPFGSRWEI